MTTILFLLLYDVLCCGVVIMHDVKVPLVSPTKTLSPHSPPSPRSLQRALLHNSSPTKPPLLKTKNVSGLVTHSAPASEGPSPVHSLDSSTESTSAPLNLQLQQQQQESASGASNRDMSNSASSGHQQGYTTDISTADEVRTKQNIWL